MLDDDDDDGDDAKSKSNPLLVRQFMYTFSPYGGSEFARAWVMMGWRALECTNSNTFVCTLCSLKSLFFSLFTFRSGLQAR